MCSVGSWFRSRRIRLPVFCCCFLRLSSFRVFYVSYFMCRVTCEWVPSVFSPVQRTTIKRGCGPANRHNVRRRRRTTDTTSSAALASCDRCQKFWPLPARLDATGSASISLDFRSGHARLLRENPPRPPPMQLLCTAVLFNHVQTSAATTTNHCFVLASFVG